MARSRLHEIEVDDTPDEADGAELVDGAVERGRGLLAHVPGVVAVAREALDGAQEEVDGLADLGIVATSGFALGLNAGLLLAGAPRSLVVACSTIPLLLTFRSALRRMARPDRLVN